MESHSAILKSIRQSRNLKSLEHVGPAACLMLICFSSAAMTVATRSPRVHRGSALPPGVPPHIHFIDPHISIVFFRRLKPSCTGKYINMHLGKQSSAMVNPLG